MTIMTTDDNLPDEVPITYAHDPGRSGPEIRAALSAEHRAEFDAEWSAAVAHAGRTFDLDPAQRLLDRWHTTAVLDFNPELAADFQQAAERYDAGLEPTSPFEYRPQSDIDADDAADAIRGALDDQDLTDRVVAAVRDAGFRFVREDS